jgi:hypothetical protein
MQRLEFSGAVRPIHGSLGVKRLRGEALRTNHRTFSIRFKNVHSDWNFGCISNIVNVFETGITLRDRSEVGPEAIMPCRLQLRGGSASLHWDNY